MELTYVVQLNFQKKINDSTSNQYHLTSTRQDVWDVGTRQLYIPEPIYRHVEQNSNYTFYSLI